MQRKMIIIFILIVIISVIFIDFDFDLLFKLNIRLKKMFIIVNKYIYMVKNNQDTKNYFVLFKRYYMLPFYK